MNSYGYRSARAGLSKRKRPIRKLIFGVLLVGVGLLILFNRFGNERRMAPAADKKAKNQTNQESAPPIKTLPNVQQIVENFISDNSGEYSVVVTDISTDKQLAGFKIDRQYFAASLYKIYVAYLGYIDVQNKEQSLQAPFLGNWTLGECLDKMIRESHSPCAEKLWAQQGKAESTERLRHFGVKNTNMESLTTTAGDIDTILVRLYQRKDLNDTHTDLFLKSLEANIYRDVLPAALPELVVMDKVGFRELVEYHDAGVVILPNNRAVAVTLLTKNAGTRRMVSLTQLIFKPLLEVSN